MIIKTAMSYTVLPDKNPFCRLSEENIGDKKGADAPSLSISLAC
ncbi:hypothetical protein VITU102760_12125 [Vibrio tubiashii]|jgi:hypothetical protein